MSNRKHINCSEDIAFLILDKQYSLSDLTKDELKIVQKSINDLLETSATPTKDNVIKFPVEKIAEQLYQIYPRKTGKARGMQLLLAYLQKGRLITGQGRVKYNHIQLDIAIQAYAKKVKDVEEQFIKVFSTFMNLPVCDFVDSTQEIYENYMLKKYGDGWKKIKFIYE